MRMLMYTINAQSSKKQLIHRAQLIESIYIDDDRTAQNLAKYKFKGAENGKIPKSTGLFYSNLPETLTFLRY